MFPLRIARTCFIGLFVCLAVPIYAQRVDTRALQARADSLNQTAVSIYQAGDPLSAAEYFEEAIGIWETVKQEMSAGCALSYNGLGLCHMMVGDLDQALTYYEKARSIRSEVLGERHPDYATVLSNIGVCYLYKSNYEEAMAYSEKAATIRREVLGEGHPDYATSLNNIGLCYWRLGDYDEALAYYKKALQTMGEEHPTYTACLTNIGGCLMELGEYEEGLVYLTQSLEVCERIVGKEHPNYATMLNNLSACYFEMGDLDKAIQYLTEAVEVSRNAYGEMHPLYAASLSNLGSLYSELGDYEKAAAYMWKAQEIQREVYGDKDPDYAAMLANLAGCYRDLKEYEKAAVHFEKASGIFLELFGEQHTDYLVGLTNLGIIYWDLGDNEKAEAYFSKALVLDREVLGEHHPEYANCLYAIGVLCWDTGDYDRAVEYMKEALEIRREVLGPRHQNYALSLRSLGACYEEQGKRDSASLYMREYISLVSDLVMDAFTFLPQGQRSLYWNMYSDYFTGTIPSSARFLSNDKQFLRTAYDGALLSKGLLLNAETELRKLILESGDTAALSLYDRLQKERLQLDALYELPVEERPMPIDSLENVCETLEKELQQKSQSFGDYTKNLSISWKDVQASLGKKDIAIEFLEVLVAADTTLYCALTLKPGYDAPHYVELFDLKDLDALKAKYANSRNPEGMIYADKALYDLVWKPLEGELKGVKNIYFGPSSELYQTAIEYADNGKGPLANQKNIYRLSSTRQLAVARGDAERSRSAVFGGLKYGASEEVLLADSQKYTQRSIPDDVFFSVDSLDIRGAGGGLVVADLPGTESEALEIDALLRKMGLDNTLRMGDKGTEAAFKDLSGRQENIIHIATHGFYWNGRQARHIGERLGRNLDDNASRMQEDAAMTRSGLLFTGANNTLRGREKQEGVDDGILTAKEIAQLDLRGTDLLVLSACQTGLGEVSGEGVFGLQRGFKKAGVNTILMSLWQVDDEATSLLMTSFYKELAKGRSKSDALKAAQKAVKNYKDKDFSSPYYWAAFILLDGE